MNLKGNTILDKCRLDNTIIKILFMLCVSLILGMMTQVTALADTLRDLTFTDYEPTITEVIDDDSGLTHPGIGVTKEELENVRVQIKNGVDPWSSYLEGMLKSSYASKNYYIRNQDSNNPEKAKYTYKDYSSSFMENTIQKDAMAAYIQSLLYYFTGDEDYRRNAITILRLWSQLDPSEATNVADGKIKMSYPMYYMVSAAELLKHTSCESEDLVWTEEDNYNFSNNFVKPPLKYYLASEDSINYWLNQYSYALVGRISADIYLDDIDDYTKAVEMATVNSDASDRYGSGALSNVLRKVNEEKGYEDLDDSVIELVEMGRDQPHAAGNLVCLTNIAYMFDSQGTKVDQVTGEISTDSNSVSMFNFLDNRLLRGVNYFLKYNLGYETMWYPVSYGSSSIYDSIYDQGRGRFHNLETLYYYYSFDSSTKDLMSDESVGKYLTELYEKYPSPETGNYINYGTGIDFWLHIPETVANTSVNFKGESTEALEVENRYTLINGNVNKENNGEISYLNIDTDEEGSEIALLYVPTVGDRSGYSVINLRIKTNGVSKLELKRDSNSVPFKIVDVPDTNGKWTDFVIDINVNEVSYTQYPQDIQIMYFNITGQVGNYVNIDNLRINTTNNYAPEFENLSNEKTITSYVNTNMSLDFSAIDKNGDTLTYKIINGPENAVLDEKTGVLNWIPNKEGSYEFFIQVSDGIATSILKVKVNIEKNIENVVDKIIENYDSDITYTTETKNSYDVAYAKIQQLIANNETDEDIIFEAINNLQQAVNGLEKLTPLLNDGSLDYSKIVTSSLSNLREINLVDGDTESFTGDLRSPNNYFVLDFGKDYVVSSTSFKIQSRKYFPGRIWKTVVYGSNDGVSWVALTNKDVGSTAEMIELPVLDEYKDLKFRYIKVGSSASIFNPSEFRIVGSRYESTNRIETTSIESNNVDSTKAIPGDKVTLSFKTKEEINNINVLIAGQEANVITVDDTNYIAEITVHESVSIGKASFTINYDTLDGETGLEISDTTDDTSVFLTNEINLINVLDGSIDFIDSTGANRSKAETLRQVEYLFDNNLSTCSDFRLNGSGYGAYIIFDFKDEGTNLSRVEVAARQDGYYTRIAGLTVLGSNDGETWTTLSSNSAISTKQWQLLNINSDETYRYIKITNSGSWYGNMGELRLYN